MPIKGVKRVKGGVVYRGEKFPGFNKPKIAPKGSPAKRRVLAKKGDKVKVINFGKRGYSDYTKHKSEKRRRSYLARSGGIRNKAGKLTKDDKFSANYFARRYLW